MYLQGKNRNYLLSFDRARAPYVLSGFVFSIWALCQSVRSVRQMADQALCDLFSDEKLTELFSPDRSDRFFDALYGDASDGAYDISLVFKGGDNRSLQFEFHLNQRPGKCLVCSLTYGLPEVFSRHPIINLKGLSSDIALRLNSGASVKGWEVGRTIEISSSLHVIPFAVHLE